MVCENTSGVTAQTGIGNTLKADRCNTSALAGYHFAFEVALSAI